MRLGEQLVLIDEGSLAHDIYASREISERHRHRYEVNPDYIDRIEEGGLKFTGRDEEGIRMEICEYPDHPYFIASQFHPEFKSRPMRPTPMFHNLILHALRIKNEGR